MEKLDRVEVGMRFRDKSGPYTITEFTGRHEYRFLRDGQRNDSGGVGLCDPLNDDFLGYAPGFGPTESGKSGAPVVAGQRRRWHAGKAGIAGDTFTVRATVRGQFYADHDTGMDGCAVDAAYFEDHSDPIDGPPQAPVAGPPAGPSECQWWQDTSEKPTSLGNKPFMLSGVQDRKPHQWKVDGRPIYFGVEAFTNGRLQKVGHPDGYPAPVASPAPTGWQPGMPNLPKPPLGASPAPIRGEPAKYSAGTVLTPCSPVPDLTRSTDRDASPAAPGEGKPRLPSPVRHEPGGLYGRLVGEMRASDGTPLTALGSIKAKRMEPAPPVEPFIPSIDDDFWIPDAPRGLVKP